MIHFKANHRFNHAYKWCTLNASGECSILVDLPSGTAVYVWDPSINPVWRRLYGPVMEARNASN